jgi:hypothetical protein
MLITCGPVDPFITTSGAGLTVRICTLFAEIVFAQFVDKPVVVILVAVQLYEPAVKLVGAVLASYIVVAPFPVPVIVAGALLKILSVMPLIDQAVAVNVVGVEQYCALLTTK